MGDLLIYALVVLVATASGSSTGLGGGVVIKPLFDIVSNAPTATINFYSSLAVFIMAVVALGKQLRQRFKFDVKSLLTISIGSVIGGFIGQRLLRLTVTVMPAAHVKVLQSAMLFIMLVSVLIYNFVKKRLASFHLKNILLILVVGIGLGTFSVFLGIAGGFLGTWINRHASCRVLNQIYNVLLCALVCVTLFNTFHYAGVI